MTVPILKLSRLNERARVPGYVTSGSAGMDLHAAVEHEVSLQPGERRLIGTGLAIELPPGFEGQVRPRSGLAVKHGLTVLNAPGTIDEDYRGEVCVALINLGQEPVSVAPGMRIAQLVVAPVVQVRISEVGELSATERGDGGFGHTGS